MADRQPIQVITEQITNFLKEFLVWCVWMISSAVAEGTTRTRKLQPHSPVDLGLISVADPFQWADYNQCVQALHGHGGWSGIGVLLTAEASVVGIELDNALTEQGVLKPWAAEFMRSVPGYWELSPFGLGLSGFLRGAMPNDV